MAADKGAVFVLIICLVGFLSATGASSSPSAINPKSAVQANILVDDFLARIAYKLDEQFEPIVLPDAGFGFEKKILLVNVKGEAKLTDGWLAGFSTLHRNGDAKLMGSPGTRILKTPLGVSNLAGHYRGSITFMNIGPKFTVDINLGQLSVEMFLMQLDGDEKAKLASLKPTHSGKIDLKVEGLGVLGWILTPINKFLVNFLRKFIWGFLEERVKLWLGEQIALENIQLPPLA